MPQVSALDEILCLRFTDWKTQTYLILNSKWLAFYHALQVSSATSGIRHIILIIHHPGVSEFLSLSQTKTILRLLSSAGRSSRDKPLIDVYQHN